VEPGTDSRMVSDAGPPDDGSAVDLPPCPGGPEGRWAAGSFVTASRKKPNWKGGKHAGRGHIPGRVDVCERPGVVQEKRRVGDWEADAIIGKGRHGAVILLVDRTSQLTLLARVECKTAKAVRKGVMGLLRPLCAGVHTITSDKGKAFADHARMSKKLSSKFYFARPYRSWGRGLNEDTSKNPAPTLNAHPFREGETTKQRLNSDPASTAHTKWRF